MSSPAPFMASRFLSFLLLTVLSLVSLAFQAHATAVKTEPSVTTRTFTKVPTARRSLWQEAPMNSGLPVRRHEACAVRVRRRILLIGGRGINKPISVYDPATKEWTQRDGPGEDVQLHHMQCVVWQGDVWIVSSWRGNFPRERNNAHIYVYNYERDEWRTHDGLPEPRRRGGAAAVRKGDYIYVIGGNRGGHGSHATSLPWMDRYNTRTDTWDTGLTSMPMAAARDHVGGALVRGQLCIAGGRDGGSDDFFNSGKKETYCYSTRKNRWNKREDMPSPRAGAMTGRTCDGKMMVAGGEGSGQAFARVDMFDGRRWTSAPDMREARHGSGLAKSLCSCGHIFIPSGSGGQGGGPELTSTEELIPEGAPMRCSKY